MGNDVRHDHTFRVPRPDLSEKYATPNACNNCHKDKSAQWAADAIVKWYGPKRKYHFAEDLIPGSKANAESEPHLLKILGDTSAPQIIKATAANYLGSIPTAGSLNALLACLKSTNAQVRYEALRSLMNFPPDHLSEIAPLLSDKVRAVRIAAADLFVTLAGENIPPAYLNAFNSANAELYQYLLYQADFAHGNIFIADYYMKIHDPKNAEKFYWRAIHKDSLANLARINLSILYNTEGKNQEALQVLETAAGVDNRNAQVYYNIALLQNEMNNKNAALQNFEKAYQLKSENPRLYYNYALLLQQFGNPTKAIQVLETGLRKDPTSASLNYAAAFIYLQNKQITKAHEFGMALKKIDPNNPEYQQLFATLGIH